MPYRKWLLLTAMIAITASITAQSKNSLVNEKRKTYDQINASPSLKKITLENEDFLVHMTDGGGELVGYYNKDVLVKIKEWIGLSQGNRTRMYYFKDDQLFLVVEKFNSFVPQGDGLDKSKTKTTFEGSYYFHNNKLISQEVKGKRNFDDVADIGSSLPREAQENVRILTSRKKSLQ
jgi:hypothetical protein